jgi:SAM-dependent methyltransferase
MSVSNSMRRDWDDRARKNAFHYIASWRDSWDIDSFLASGERDYEQFVSSALERCGLPWSGDIVVELGRGAGRMTRTFAQYYEKAPAIDISAEMLRQARQIHSATNNNFVDAGKWSGPSPCLKWDRGLCFQLSCSAASFKRRRRSCGFVLERNAPDSSARRHIFFSSSMRVTSPP